ncbi:hypothetical protein B1729_05270 [Microbacterium sp. B35-04]|nr:hypothetical protein B1729_05270 [Microbacterium sp. B35-04]
MAKRKIRKFLNRSADGLGQPIIDLRDVETGQMTMQLVWATDDQGRPTHIIDLEQPTLDRETLNSVIVDCRVFFLAQEDCFLPGVVSALRSLLTPEQSRDRRPLVQHVAQIVNSRGLTMPEGRAPMYSGRLESDNGLGPYRLLGTDQVTMDYIYGVALHEDDERRARLENVDEESIPLAVILQLDSLLRVIRDVRRQVVHDLESGYFGLD